MVKRRDEKFFSEKVSNRSKVWEEKRTPLDKYADQKFVDDIPLKELKIETEQEKNKHKTQDTSQSEKSIKLTMKSKDRLNTKPSSPHETGTKVCFFTETDKSKSLINPTKT